MIRLIIAFSLLQCLPVENQILLKLTTLKFKILYSPIYPYFLKFSSFSFHPTELFHRNN